MENLFRSFDLVVWGTRYVSKVSFSLECAGDWYGHFRSPLKAGSDESSVWVSSGTPDDILSGLFVEVAAVCVVVSIRPEWWETYVYDLSRFQEIFLALKHPINKKVQKDKTANPVKQITSQMWIRPTNIWLLGITWVVNSKDAMLRCTDFIINARVSCTIVRSSINLLKLKLV